MTLGARWRLRRGRLAEVAGGVADGFEQTAIGVGRLWLLIEAVGDGVELLCRGFAFFGGGVFEGLGEIVESACRGFEVGAGECIAYSAGLLILAVLAREAGGAGEGAAGVVDGALFGAGFVLELSGFLGQGFGGLGAGVVGVDLAAGEFGFDLTDRCGGALFLRCRLGIRGGGWLGSAWGLRETGELAASFFVGDGCALGLQSGGIGDGGNELMGEDQREQRERCGGPGPTEAGLQDPGGVHGRGERFGTADGGGDERAFIGMMRLRELDRCGECVLGRENAVGLACGAGGRPRSACGRDSGGDRCDGGGDNRRSEGEHPPVQSEERGQRNEAQLGEDDGAERDEQHAEEPEAEMMDKDGNAVSGGDACRGRRGEPGAWKRRRGIAWLDSVERYVFASHAGWYESSSDRDRMQAGDPCGFVDAGGMAGSVEAGDVAGGVRRYGLSWQRRFRTFSRSWSRRGT